MVTIRVNNEERTIEVRSNNRLLLNRPMDLALLTIIQAIAEGQRIQILDFDTTEEMDEMTGVYQSKYLHDESDDLILANYDELMKRSRRERQ